MTNQPIIKEETFDAPLMEVWEAITDVDKMKKWYFDNIPAFKPEVGFETEFNVSSGERNFLHRWKIVAVALGTKVKYSWQFKEYPGEGFVTFELFDKGEQTLLRLTAENMDSFPQDVPEFSRESCSGGWDYFIHGRLKEYFT